MITVANPAILAAFSCAALFSMGFAQTQADEPKKAAQAGRVEEACFSGVQTALDAPGGTIVLTTKQLDERATWRVLPEFPALFRQANDAIMQWRFRPYKVHGKRLSVLGHFDFCSTSGCPFIDLPHTSGQ